MSGALYRARTVVAVLAGITGAGVLATGVAAGGSSVGSAAAPPVPTIVSTTKVCELTGASGETGTPTSAYGLAAADIGYPLSYEGQTWFLFGDAVPYKGNAKARWPADPASLVNDAIGYESGKSDGCPDLTFVTRAPGSYADPSVAPDPSGGATVDLRTNMQPEAGVGIGSSMYVVFITDNPECDAPGVTPAMCKANGIKGFSTRAVLGVDTGPRESLAFRGLYNFSAPVRRWQPGARFVFDTFAPGPDGWLYVFGTEGGTDHRNSDVFLARVEPSELGTPGTLAYFTGLRDGQPEFSSTAGEASAVPLWTDDARLPCAGDLGAQWNPYLARWVLIYTCNPVHATYGNLGGIWVRVAAAPWGPWSAPETIFNPTRDHGYCEFIHYLHCPPGSPNPYNHTSKGASQDGSDYGAHIIPGWTTSQPSPNSTGVLSTFYWVMDTFDPYGEVIMSTTLSESYAQRFPPLPTSTTLTSVRPPPCGTACV
ncbi:MAG TPA: DUF4185 domain-containing protein [Acidimicrobiales bacterium]|nr:DUF4185 domain-containing protein [Acidimicrobiales bacterium]